jgi:hypothetical protein
MNEANLNPSQRGVWILSLDDAIEFVMHEAENHAQEGDLGRAIRLYQRVIKLTEGASVTARERLTGVSKRLSEINTLTACTAEGARK